MTSIHTQHDIEVAPELEGLNLADKPDGPGGAVMLAAGIGVLVLGLLTTGAVISTSLKNFLGDFEFGQGVGPLAGKTILASAAFFGSWGGLHLAWREKDVDLKKLFNIGLALGIAGALLTFPPVFDLFK